MNQLRQLAQPQIDAAAASTPSLDTLRAATHRRRHRRRLHAGAAALVLVVAVGGAVMAVDNDGERTVQSLGAEDDASIPRLRLPALGDETIVASGQIGRTSWELIAYRTTPSADGLERICSEFRTARIGPQSCFPFDPDRPPGERWAFVEYVAGAPILVGASTPGHVVTVDGVPLEGLDEELGLPVRLGALVLEGDGPFSLRTGGMVSLLPMLDPGDGTRQPVATPGLVGIFWERLTSDNPARDGWVRVSAGPSEEVGYLNPDDYWLHREGDRLTPDAEPEPFDPPPVYDAQGRRIGWMSCGSFSTERYRDCDVISPTTTDVDGP